LTSNAGQGAVAGDEQFERRPHPGKREDRTRTIAQHVPGDARERPYVVGNVFARAEEKQPAVLEQRPGDIPDLLFSVEHLARLERSFTRTSTRRS
jgi:hypothetical protein